MKKFWYQIFFAILVLLVAKDSVRAADEILLPLPFENISGRSDYQWISDSFAIALADLLDTPGLVVLSPDERLLACDRAGIRPCDSLTLAAKLRLAEFAQANLVLIGTFEISGENNSTTLAVTAKLVETREGRVVGKSFNFSGPIGDLQTLQGLLAWSILYERDPALPYSQDQFKRRARRIPLRAFEFYVKSLQATDLQSREIFLKRSIKEYNEAESVGHYAQAIYELGVVDFRQKEYAEAIRNFRELIKDDPRYLESLFFLGLAEQSQSQIGSAAETYERLAAAMPLVEVLNNAGALQISKGDFGRAQMYLQRAAVASQQDASVRFNYGYALWRDRKFEQAANEFQAAVQINPKDGEAQYLLAESLSAIGKKTESEQADQEARKLLSANNTYAQWKTKPDKIPTLIRLKTDYNRVNFYRLNRQRSSATNLPPAQTRLALQSLDRAKQLLNEKNDEGAWGELQNVLSNDPTLAEAHYLRAQILQRRSDIEGALSGYAAAIYWNPRLSAGHLALAKLYLGRGDRNRAASHAKLTLEIDPQNQDALAIKRQLEGNK
ncbi:MAG: tetratricopeptide repeat protein [Acidobacteria bacterium]|nr:tetratricopeptide repeat protein [Acidobacteriota bacterium]